MLAAKIKQALGMEGNVALWNGHSSKGEEDERSLISEAAGGANISLPNKPNQSNLEETMV